MPKPAMLLEIGKKINRYTILSLLGSGGMGEVYLAEDSNLKRKVTIKILKKHDDPESLRRFKQEARAASALNHPHILSIHEFGRHENFHYLVAEFIKGQTLRQIISEKSLNLIDACEIAIQIGSTLAVAHEENIIHRDIKPENIMVLPDGYIKILDFGLAKLEAPEKASSKVQSESTISLFQRTEPGILIGTVNYMSPEQLRAQPTDSRTDIWSLGVVLFEMISAGRHPFCGESVNDTIAAILERSPPSITNFLPLAPENFDLIFSKTLAKKREDRYSNAAEFVADLRILTDDLKTRDSLDRATFLSSSGSNIQTTNSNNPATDQRDSFPTLSRSAFLLRRLLISVICLFSFFGIVLFFYSNYSSPKEITSKHTKTKIISTVGNVLNAVISPNGQFILYVEEDGGLQSLRLRQVNELADTVLIPARNVSYSSIQFSPDSNNIFYTVFADSPTGQLFRKPILGGTAQKIADDIDSAVAFSSDGSQFAFIRSKSHEGVDQIITSNADGSNMLVKSERREPERYSISVRESLAWSPDGKTIACAAGTIEESGEKMSIVKIDLTAQTETAMTTQSWFRIGKIYWSKEEDSLIFTAADFGSEQYQIFRLSVTDGRVEKITTELNDYQNISLTGDSKSLLAVTDEKASNIYIAPARNPNQAVQIAGGGNQEGIGGIAWTPDNSILYVSAQSGHNDIWIMDQEGKNRRPLTFSKSADELPSISTDGKQIAYISSQTGVPHVWLMNSDGTNNRQLTNKSGENFPQITPDGSAVLYSAKPLKIWKIFTNGVTVPDQVTDTPVNWITLSPDGTRFAGLTMDPDLPMQLSIFSSETGKSIKSFNLSGEVGNPDFPPVLRWNPDGQSIAYISTKNGVSNIMRQPLVQTAVPPQKLTDFSADRIFTFDFSKDGSKLAFARGVARKKLLLFEDF